MFRKKVCLLFSIIGLLLLPLKLVAAGDFNISSPRAIALGGNLVASVGAGVDEILAHNPAGIIVNGNGLSLYYDNPFSFSNYEVSGCNLNLAGNRIGLGVSYFNEKVGLPEENQGELIGKNSLSKTMIGVGFGGKVFGSIGWGIGFKQYEQSFYIYDNDNQRNKELAMNLGLMFDSNLWSLGVSFDNLPLIANNVLLKPGYKIGTRFGKKDKTTLLLGVEKYENVLGKSVVNTSAGIEAWVAPNLALRIGTNAEGLLSFGLGLINNKWQINYAYRIHQAGETHYLATGYCF